MKLKFFIIFSMLCGIFALTSCCETKEEEQVERKPVYELSLHQMYLKIEERHLQKKIDSLKEDTDAYHATQIVLDSVQRNLNEIEELFKEKSTPEKLIGPNGKEIFLGVIGPIGPIGPDGPIPVPDPSPCNCTIPLSNLMVIVPDGLEHFDLRIKNVQNEVIGGLSKTREKLSSGQIDFNAYQLNIPANLEGQIIIEVTKHSNITGGMLTYSFRSNLPKK